MLGYFCTRCNSHVGQPNPQLPCNMCNQPEVDDYFRFHRSLIILDILLFRVAAYRHILKNRFQQLSKNSILLLTVGSYVSLILLELFHKHRTMFTSRGDETIQPDNASPMEFFSMGSSIGVSLGRKMLTLILGFIVIYFKSIRQKKITLPQILFSLIICQYARLSNILFVIWEHQAYIRQMGSLSIFFAEITAVRALIEVTSLINFYKDNQQWIIPTLLVSSASFISGSFQYNDLASIL